MNWKSISTLGLAIVAAGCAPDRELPTGPGEVSTYVSNLDALTAGTSIHHQLDDGGPCVTTTTALGYVIPDPYGSCWTVADEWGLGRIATLSTADDFDERVVDLGGGNLVWRFSNAVTGSFSDQPNSPSSPAVAGETGALLWNDRGPNHTTPTAPGGRAAPTTPYFHGSFRFKSATGAAQADLTLNISPTARQSDRRNSFIGLADAGSGLNVTFFDTGIYPGTGGAGAVPFVGSTIATGLSYTDWHKIDIYVEFVDGLSGDGSGNDIVTVLVNDVVAHVGTTWETYYQIATPTRPVGAVDALFFRSSGTARPANLGNGFFFDDVVVDNAALAPADILAPVVSNVVASPNPAAYGTPLILTATATDIVGVTTASYTINLGTPVLFSAFTTSASVSLSANLGTLDVGVYDICVTAEDAAGNESNTECTMLAVYDPTAGFVTGGGWFMSPAGAYVDNELLTGKATFGFVSKYVKGKTLPTGNTQFQFQAGGLSFSSSAYEWLVVNQGGTNAQFKGTGALNGVPGYKFMVWAKDGTPDTFRIQIEDGAGMVVYDNKQESDFGTTLGGGSIVIHVPKK